MADIYLKGGDINVSDEDMAVVEGQDEILQFAVNAIATIFGELIFHPDVGNRVFGRRLKVTKTDAGTIIRDCTNAIMADDRVIEVPFMEISYEEEDKSNVNVKFTLKAVDGTLISSMTTISLK